MVTHQWPSVEFFFEKINGELWKIIENYYFIMESEGYLYFQKFTSALKKLRLFWHRVYASRDIGNVAEQI